MKKTLKDIINEEYQKLLVKNKNKPLSEGWYGDNVPDDYNPRKDPWAQDDDDEEDEEPSAEELWDQYEEARNDLHDDVKKELSPIHPHNDDGFNVTVSDIIDNDISWVYDKGPEIYKSPEKIAEIMMQEDSGPDGLGVRPAEEYKLFANKLLPFFEKYEHVQNLFDNWKEKDDQEKRRHRRRLREGKEDQKPLAESVNKRLLKLAGIK